MGVCKRVTLGVVWEEAGHHGPHSQPPSSLHSGDNLGRLTRASPPRLECRWGIAYVEKGKQIEIAHFLYKFINFYPVNVWLRHRGINLSRPVVQMKTLPNTKGTSSPPARQQARDKNQTLESEREHATQF